MIKIIGVVILSISSFFIGLLFYQKYKTRPESLEMLLNMLNIYRLKLKMERKSFRDVVLDEESNDLYISECKRNLICKSLEQSMINQNSYYDNLYLSGDDKIIFNNFIKRTGKLCFVDELSLCDETIDALNEQLVDSKNKMKKSGAFSIKIALAVALWIAIILL